MLCAWLQDLPQCFSKPVDVRSTNLKCPAEIEMLAYRAEGIVERCFAAAKGLALSEPGLALSFATMILACSVHDAALLARPAAFPLMQRLLQVSPILKVSKPVRHQTEWLLNVVK